MQIVLDLIMYIIIVGGGFNWNVRKNTTILETNLNIYDENEYTYNKIKSKSELDFLLTNTQILDWKIYYHIISVHHLIIITEDLDKVTKSNDLYLNKKKILNMN